ncbi:MAG TPA: hypothetical protein VMV05_08235 [bacterium]|nr:hypothetical protein [bacterium]
MNECEQIHPLLRGYLAETLSAHDRRAVARHLNLCASARKELDKLRAGPVKTPVNPVEPPREPWDLKILRWLVKKPKPKPKVMAEPESKPEKTLKPAPGPAMTAPMAASESTLKPSPSPTVKPMEPTPVISSAPPGANVPAPVLAVARHSHFKPILLIVLVFGGLIFLTHFIQNAGDNFLVKGIKRWMSKNHVMGVNSSLELVLDLTNLPHWNGNAAPVASAREEMITDSDHFNLFWKFLQPGADPPEVDFTKNAVAFVFTGAKATPGYIVKFKRMENYSDKTVLWFDEAVPTAEQAATATVTRPWVLQMVPKPSQSPVLIQKIQ